MRSHLITAALVAVGLVLVAVASGATSPTAHLQAKKRPNATLRAPGLQTPSDGATLDAVPAFTWAGVRGAAAYEFQLSADGAFRSSVFGRTGSLQTANTAATIQTTLADGNYFWRVRAVRANGDAGPWSRTRTLDKNWSQAPRLTAPATDATVNYPKPLVLSWGAVPRAFKYAIEVATDPSLGSPAPGFAKPIETSGTDFAVGLALPAGRYYWAITALDADKHKGARSNTGSFQVAWPSATGTRVQDLDPDDRVYDPQFSWDPVPGAARYQVEVNGSGDFAPGSKVCCNDPTTGTSLSPAKVLPNNTGDGGGYFWRVRAIDVDGNAGQWNVGSGFPKYFNPTSVVSIPGLRLADHTDGVASTGTPKIAYPVVTWDPTPAASSYEVEVAPTVPIDTTFQAASGATITVGSTASMILDTPISFANGNVRRIVAIVDDSHLQVDSALSSNPTGGSVVTTRVNFCNWNPSAALKKEFWDVQTAATSWTPLAPSWNGITPAGLVARTVSTDGRALVDGERYCVRVRARSDRDFQSHDVVSPWTELGNLTAGQPTFQYEEPALPPCAPLPPTQTVNYSTPQTGIVTPRLPFFAWQPVAGACSYYVIVARDEAFTDIVDIALTQDPDYAPRTGTLSKTYPDELSSYYWAAVPSPQTDGGGVSGSPATWNSLTFQKRSVGPTPLGPTGGASVATQPTFRWTAAEGARDYHLQVAQDPSFGDPIEDVTTDATAFTSSSTYPADTVLYWRVRADDENKIGLAWSRVETFQRQLPAPVPSPDNPTGGRTIPLLQWSPVEGAISYDLHVDQPDGTRRDFNLRSTAFTPTAHYGTGVWQWKVRANFPKVPTGSVPGAYSTSQPFTRFIGSPAAAHGVATPSRLLLSWDPVEMAKSYRVEISKTTSFSSLVDSTTVENTSYAPRMTNRAFQDGGVLHWRVASLDEGNTVGGFTSGTFSLPKRIQVVVKGNVRRGAAMRVIVKVTDMRGNGIRKAKVRVSGAGLRLAAKRTTARGTTVFKLTVRRRGTIVFAASKGGYRAGSKSVKVN